MNDWQTVKHHYRIARATGLNHKNAKWYARAVLRTRVDVSQLTVI